MTCRMQGGHLVLTDAAEPLLADKPQVSRQLFVAWRPDVALHIQIVPDLPPNNN